MSAPRLAERDVERLCSLHFLAVVARALGARAVAAGAEQILRDERERLLPREVRP